MCVYIDIYIHKHNGTLFSHKRDRHLPFVTTRTVLADIMLSEISHTEKDKSYMIPLMWNLKKLNSSNREYKGVYQVLRGWGELGR